MIMATIKSIEEKAKRYDDVLDRAKKELNTCGSQDCDAARQIFRFFPELKESEDERIRKSLLDFCKIAATGQTSILANSIDFNKCLAWLEKQEEKKVIIPKFRVGEKVRLKGSCSWYNVTEIRGSEYYITAIDAAPCLLPICRQDDWEGEQKPADKKGMNLVEEEMTPFQKKVFCIIDTAIEEEQGLKQVCDELFALASNEINQKSAWSEEDDNCLSTIIAEFSKCAGKSVSKDEWMRCNDFLNSLRERVQPQPKQAWCDKYGCD